MATKNKRRGWRPWRRRNKANPAQEKQEAGKGKQPTAEPTIKKGIYLSALIYVEGEQAAPADFDAVAIDALKKRLSRAIEEGGELRMTVKKIEVKNDVEEEEEKQGEGKFQF